MTDRLQEVLSGKPDNYILPFFWQRGEEEEVLREEMRRIHESGIRAVCVESRSHPDFLGPKWWKDMDIIMEEARARGMKVWVFDDDHFPTGHAAGKLKDAPHHLRRVFLSALHLDTLGPRRHSSFLIEIPRVPGIFEADTSDAVIIAVKRDAETGELLDEYHDLSQLVVNGRLYWDVPEGYWRIFIIYENRLGGDPSKRDYVNPLVRESVKVLLDTTYEAFYERYRGDFGKTFAGFFSDEPGFYSNRQSVITNFEITVGQGKTDLPWCGDLYRLLEEKLGPDYRKLLPLLWYDGEKEATTRIRYAYMSLVSKLYAENFTQQIGDWCRARGVEYIGHVIEDNNAHARLGVGAGHYFRAMGGQDMSGIDVVLWQLNPGFDGFPSAWLAGEADNEFFNYGLAKMASSLAHLDPKKKGRTVAEVFGAYGWAEGLKLMKWMTDHMLVRGVTHFIPHSFSSREFPDPDCPPHLYARGKNPQYRYYRWLNEYTNRMSHLLSGGLHIASAVVLYHAEAEWSGGYMYFHKPVRELLRAQIDCDVVSCDMLTSEARVQNQKLAMGRETYDCLIVPYSEALPGEVLTRIAALAEGGLPIYFVDGLPSRTSDGEHPEAVERLAGIRQIRVVPLTNLARTLDEAGFRQIRTTGEHPYLRYYQVRHRNLEVFMFFNEHPLRVVDTEVWLPITEPVCLYDAYWNRLLGAVSSREGDRTRIHLHLSPYESIVILSGPDVAKFGVEPATRQEDTVIPITSSWSVSTASAEEYPDFHHWRELSELTDLSHPGLLPNFSGTIRYEAVFDYEGPIGQQVWIDLGEAYETAEVFVNGRSAGVRIAPPYRFDATGFIRPGSNTLIVEVTNTLAKQMPDFFSRTATHEPSGLLGPVRLLVRGMA